MSTATKAAKTSVRSGSAEAKSGKVSVSKKKKSPTETAAAQVEPISVSTHETPAQMEATSEDTELAAGSENGEGVIAHEGKASAAPSAEGSHEPIEQAQTAQSTEAQPNAAHEPEERPQTASGNLGERYLAATQEVSRLRKEYLIALDDKARLIGGGVQRVGEAVPIRNAEIDSLNAEIQAARENLNNLMQRKREMKGNSPELDEVNRRINELRRQRNEARETKKSAYHAAMTAQNPAQES